MGLYAIIANIWADFSPHPPRRRGNFCGTGTDTIHAINHWFPGNRTQKAPRRLVETPTAGHWPEHRVAKKVVGKGRKRCEQCGALLKHEGAAVKAKAKSEKASGKKADNAKRQDAAGVKNLRGRAVKYAK